TATRLSDCHDRHKLHCQLRPVDVLRPAGRAVRDRHRDRSKRQYERILRTFPRRRVHADTNVHTNAYSHGDCDSDINPNAHSYSPPNTNANVYPHSNGNISAPPYCNSHPDANGYGNVYPNRDSYIYSDTNINSDSHTNCYVYTHSDGHL